MNKIAYLLSVGLMVSLLGCGNAPIKDTPTSIPTMNITTPVVEVTKPVIVQPTPTPKPTLAPVVKKINTTSTPKQVPVVAKKWVVTNTYSGSGMKTESLAITNDTRITWEVTSVAPKANGIPVDSFNYFIKDSQGYPYVVDILFAHRSGVGKGTTYLKAVPGKYSFYANAANCEWTITVEQQK